MKFKSLITTILVFFLLSLFLYSFFDKQKEILEPLENDDKSKEHSFNYCEKRTEMVLRHKAETDKILSSITQINSEKDKLMNQIKENKEKIGTNEKRIDNIRVNIQKRFENPTKGESIPEIKR